MKKLLFIFFTAGLIQGFSSCSHKDTPDNALALIPQPQEMKVGTDHFKLTRRAAITLDTSNPQLIGIARYFNNKVAPATGFEIPVEKHGNIEFKLTDNTAFGAEGYRLQVKHGDIIITAHQPAGIFYGIQTLLQMLPPEIKNSQKQKGIDWTVPCADITDKPQFAWRGLMLDVSRHWFTKEEVKKYIDELAEYKMNVFHWHLTDDQGWRLEIKSLPRLTEVGAWRAPRVGQWWQRAPQQPGEETTYGGFYTQEDVKEVLAYAAERYVRVIPEIDVPGHSLAALVAYPDLACMKAPSAVGVGNKFYGEDENTLCVGKDATFEFMDKVLTEVAALFPYRRRRMFQRFLAQMSTLPSSHESGKPEERKRTTKLLYPPYGKHLERKREKADRLGRDYRRRAGSRCYRYELARDGGRNQISKSRSSCDHDTDRTLLHRPLARRTICRTGHLLHVPPERFLQFQPSSRQCAGRNDTRRTRQSLG